MVKEMHVGLAPQTEAQGHHPISEENREAKGRVRMRSVLPLYVIPSGKLMKELYLG